MIGDAYDPEKNSKKLSYNKLADILGNKANELNAVKYGAASTIPGLAQGYEEIRNSPMMHEVNSFYMDPAVSQIANGYNPIEDTQKNYPVYYSLGVAGGTAAQTALAI